MTDLKKLACLCGFESESAEGFATHVAETGHGMDPEMVKDLRDGSGFASFVEMLQALQQVQPGDPRVSRVDPDDEDLPPEVREALKKVEEEGS